MAVEQPEHQQREQGQQPGYGAVGVLPPQYGADALAEDHPLTFDQYAQLPFRSFIQLHARFVDMQEHRQVTLSECMDRYLSHLPNRERLTRILGTRREGYNPIQAFYQDINRQLGEPDDIFRPISAEETFAFIKKLLPHFDFTHFWRFRFFQYDQAEQPDNDDRELGIEFRAYLRLASSFRFALTQQENTYLKNMLIHDKSLDLKNYLFPVRANRPQEGAAEDSEEVQQYKRAVAHQEAQWKDLLSKPKTKLKKWTVRIPGQRNATTLHLSHSEATALYRKLHQPAKPQWIAGLILGAPFILLRAVAGMFLQVPHFVSWVHRYVDYKETKYKEEHPEEANQPAQEGILGKLKNMGGGKTSMKFKAMKFALLLLTPVVFVAGFFRGLRDAILLTYYEGVSAAVKSALEGVNEGKKFYHTDADTSVDKFNEETDVLVRGQYLEPVPEGQLGPARQVTIKAFKGAGFGTVGGWKGANAETHHRISLLSMLPIWYSKEDGRWIYEKELVWQATFLIGLPILFIMSPMMAFGIGSSFVFANSNRLPFAMGLVTVVALLALTFFFPPVGAAMTAFFAHLPLLSGVTAGFHTAFMAVGLYAGIVGTYLMQAIGIALVNVTYGVGVVIEKITDVAVPLMPKAWDMLKTIGRGLKTAGIAIAHGFKALPSLIARLFTAIKTKFQAWRQKPGYHRLDGADEHHGQEMQPMGRLGGAAEEGDDSEDSAQADVQDGPLAGGDGPADGVDHDASEEVSEDQSLSAD